MGQHIDDGAFLGLTPAGSNRWDLHLEPRHLNPGAALYGGTAIAAAVHAMQEVTGHGLLWTTTRFLGSAVAGEVLAIEVSIDVAGRRTSQLSVRGRRGDEVVFEAFGACGDGPEDAVTDQWIALPDAPPPDECPPVPSLVELEGTFLDTLERRVAFGSFPGPGSPTGQARLGLWARVKEQDSTTAPMLAWLADCMPLGVGSSLGRLPFGTSLDNTLRLGGRAAAGSGWLLADIRPSAARRGYAYGDVDLWAQDGTLLATGSQTAVIKPPPAAWAQRGQASSSTP